MAQGRMIARKISANKDLPRLMVMLDERMGVPHGSMAMLLYTWSIAHLDVEGRMHGDPFVVKGAVVPRITFITPDLVEVYLLAMAEVGLVAYYEADGDRWLQFLGFEGSQPGLRKDRETPSKIPAMETGQPVAITQIEGGCRSNSGTTPESLRHPSGVTPAEVEEKFKGKGREGEGVAGATPGLSQGELNLKSPKPGKAAKADKPNESYELVTFYEQAWVERFAPADGKPPFRHESYFKHAKTLIGAYGLEAAKNYVLRFVQDQDQLMVKRGHKFVDLAGRIDAYRVAGGATGPPGSVGYAQPGKHNDVSEDATDNL